MNDAERMPLVSLTWDAQPEAPAVVVLVLHGGAVDGHEANHSWSHNVLRLLPFSRALARIPGPIAVARLRFRFRGWNGEAADPVVDAQWALDQIRATHPGLPIAVVGHSMGGRVALHLGDEPLVRLVVALAPWIERGDPAPEDGRRTVIIHGDRDVICGLSRSRGLVETLRQRGRDASLVRVARSDHAMLIRAGLWTSLVVGLVEATFADELGTPVGPRRGEAGAVIAQVVDIGGIFDI